MFDYFMINYVTNATYATFFLMFFLTILSYLFALKSKEKSHQVLGMFLFYLMFTMSLITIILSSILIYNLEKELDKEDINRLVENGYITKDVALIINQNIKSKLIERDNGSKSVNQYSITYITVRDAIRDSNINNRKIKDSEAIENAKLKAQEIDDALMEALRKKEANDVDH